MKKRFSQIKKSSDERDSHKWSRVKINARK